MPCRQSGNLLLCYGLRCAHLHSKRCLQELPGLHAACKEVAAALQQAYNKVEGGQLQDHPKLAALKAVLTTVSAIQPVRLYVHRFAQNLHPPLIIFNKDEGLGLCSCFIFSHLVVCKSLHIMLSSKQTSSAQCHCMIGMKSRLGELVA